MNKNILSNTVAVLFSLNVLLIDSEHSTSLCPRLLVAKLSALSCFLKELADPLKACNLLSPIRVSLQHTAQRKERGKGRNRRESNMFREGVARRARNYISISLTSISRKNGNTRLFAGI